MSHTLAIGSAHLQPQINALLHSECVAVPLRLTELGPQPLLELHPIERVRRLTQSDRMTSLGSDWRHLARRRNFYDTDKELGRL